MDIPWKELQPETLRSLVEEFVTRHGTDYGMQEAAFETKISQVLKQLEKGKAKVVFDDESQSCDIREVDPLTRPFPQK